jgi:hypothetical protein
MEILRASSIVIPSDKYHMPSAAGFSVSVVTGCVVGWDAGEVVGSAKLGAVVRIAKSAIGAIMWGFMVAISPLRRYGGGCWIIEVFSLKHSGDAATASCFSWIGG